MKTKSTKRHERLDGLCKNCGEIIREDTASFYQQRRLRQGLSITCTICQADAEHKWSVPTYAGFIVDNDWPYDWSPAPACERCYEEHIAGTHVQLTFAMLKKAWDDTIKQEEID